MPVLYIRVRIRLQHPVFALRHEIFLIHSLGHQVRLPLINLVQFRVYDGGGTGTEF